MPIHEDYISNKLIVDDTYHSSSHRWYMCATIKADEFIIEFNGQTYKNSLSNPDCDPINNIIEIYDNMLITYILYNIRFILGIFICFILSKLFFDVYYTIFSLAALFIMIIARHYKYIVMVLFRLLGMITNSIGNKDD